MGYSTDYYLNAKPVTMELYERIDRSFNTINCYLEPHGVAATEGSWEDLDDTWYNHEKDMVDISVMYPEVLFTLSGVGEQPDDIWRQYFKNGKMQFCPAYHTYWPMLPNRWSGIHKNEWSCWISDIQPTELERRMEDMRNAVYQGILTLMGVNEDEYPWDEQIVVRATEHMVSFMLHEGLPVKLPLWTHLRNYPALPPTLGGQDNDK